MVKGKPNTRVSRDYNTKEKLRMEFRLCGNDICNSKVAHLAILIQQGMSQAHFLVFIVMVIIFSSSVPDEMTQIIREEATR